MNSTELGILSKNLGCQFTDEKWYPYHQNNFVAYKTAKISLEGYIIVISVWSKKTTFRVLNERGGTWFSFNIDHKYNLYLWSKEQMESFLLQQVALQKTKEMFSNSASAKLENSSLTYWSLDPCLY